MSHSNRRDFVTALGVAIPGLILGCKTQDNTVPVVVSPAAGQAVPEAQPVAVHRLAARKYVESDRERRLGEQAWKAVPDRAEYQNENTEIQGNFAGRRAYEQERHGLIETFAKLDVSLMHAQTGASSTWSGGQGRDYVAAQFAHDLNKAIDGYERRTGIGLHYALPDRSANSVAGAGVDALRAAAGRALAMASGGGPEQPGASRIEDVENHHIEPSYMRTAFEIQRIRYRVDNIFEKAGWADYNVPIPNYDQDLKTLNEQFGNTPADKQRDVPPGAIASFFQHRHEMRIEKHSY